MSTDDGARAARRLPALGLRARLMLVGVAGLVVGFAVGGVLLVGVLGYALQRTIDADAFKTAEAVALLADEDALPDPLPVAGGGVRVQVIDARGRVIAASIDADRLVPMLLPAELPEGRERTRGYVPGPRLGFDGPVRVVSVPAGKPQDPLTVLVATSVADAQHSVRLLRTALLITFPVLVGGLAVVAWRVIGATLRPVEALRAGAERITGGAGAGRLPVPASRDEIHRLAVTLNDMLDRLQRARARQRAFVADAAHELRSPLANIRTQVEVAQRLGPQTDWPAVADDLLVDLGRLGRLVDDLLLLARTDDAGPRSAALRPVELGELLASVAARYPAPPVRLVPPDRPLWVRAAPEELRRVVANLLDNAVRHANREVVLSAGATDAGEHSITVTDDGPGIAAADRERVFDRFTRLDDARARDDGGAGLGLAIVRELVQRAGGRVDLTDATPAGTRPTPEPATNPTRPTGTRPTPEPATNPTRPTGTRPTPEPGSAGVGPGGTRTGPGLRARVWLPAAIPAELADPSL